MKYFYSPHYYRLFRILLAAYLLWWAGVFFFGKSPTRDILNSGILQVAWIVLAMPFVPSTHAQSWFFPSPIYLLGWIMLATTYMFGGILNQQNSWWIAEISFALLAYFKLTRPWIWLLLVLRQISLVWIGDAITPALGMILLHLFTFDQRWMPARRPTDPVIVFFDGICTLCNRFVDSLLQEDQSHALRFAPLQGQTAQAHNLRTSNDLPRSVVVIADNQTLHESDAVLAIFATLGGFWRLITITRFIPRRMRDALYHFIAKNRYQWFGRRDTCRLPSVEERDFFLD